MSRTYYLYDERACNNAGTANAHVVKECASMAEARTCAPGYRRCACYSAEGEYMDDERWEWDYIPSKGFTGPGAETEEVSR